MKTTTNDKTDHITPAQHRVLSFIKVNGGSAEASVMQSRGLDIRAANNLMRQNMLTLTNGVYRLKSAKVAAMSAEPAKPSAEERTGEMFADGVSNAALADDAPESAERPAGKEIAGAAEMPAKVKTERAKKPAKVVEPRACLCGCGAISKARFLPGHDAKLHSLVLKIHRKQADKSELTTAPETLDYLKTTPWMNDEIRSAVGL